MMKLRVGSKVEVLNNNVFPGMWMCGEIAAVDGDQYAIWYEFRGVTGKGTFQIVSKKSVRPYPPRSMALSCWVAGEITEVLDGGNWKTAVILEAMGEEYYRIRLVGSCEELEVHGSSLRVRHAWEDNKWFMLGRFSVLRTATIDGLTLLSARESSIWCLLLQVLQNSRSLQGIHAKSG